MIDAQAIRKAKRELDRLRSEIKEANQRISEFTEQVEDNERWAKQKAQAAADAPFGSKLGHMEWAMYYAKAAGKARTDLEIWEKRHSDALAQLQIAADNYSNVREGLPEDIDQRVELMGKYELEWFFTADRWIIDPLNCSLETFEMLCDLERRTNDALWNHFCKDDYEWESEDLEEIPLQWQQDRIANAEAFVWSCRIDSDWYDQNDFEEIALETPIVEFQDRLWDFFDKAREEGDRLEAEAEPVMGIDFGNPTSGTFTIYNPNTHAMKLFCGEESADSEDTRGTFIPAPISPQTMALYYGEDPEDLNDLASKYEALERDLSEPIYTPYKDWDAAQNAVDLLNEGLSTWLLQRKRPNPYTDYTKLTGVKRREGVTYDDLFLWAKENSERLPSPETEMGKIFRALFGREN